MQRTSGGTWALTKIFSRIATPGRFTANLTRGGEGCRIDLLLRRVYGRHHAVLQRNLHAAGIELAREIEHTVAGTVGELGLDLGLDRRGRIWLIEVNSKPFLQMTREAGSARTLSLSVQRPLRFAKYLAGFDDAPPMTATRPSAAFANPRAASMGPPSAPAGPPVMKTPVTSDLHPSPPTRPPAFSGAPSAKKEERSNSAQSRVRHTDDVS